ncbi:MAG: hypothetical protein COB62_08110, partial [Piscirickettsiaceae bacterium]
TSFSATVFKDKDNNLTLAIKGTSERGDYYPTDLNIGLYGAGYDQILAMKNWWLRASTPAGQSVQQFAIQHYSQLTGQAPEGAVFLYTETGSGPVPIPQDYYMVSTASVIATGDVVQALSNDNDGRLDITGHSLGGHLAMAFGTLFSGHTSKITTFNAPGFTSSPLNQNFFTALGGSVPTGQSTTNVIANQASGDDVTWSGIAGWHSRPGTAIDIAIEDQFGLDSDEPFLTRANSRNHSQMILTDSLAVYNMLDELVPALTTSEYHSILSNVTNTTSGSYERIVDTLEALFGLNDTPLPTGNNQRNELYKAIYSVRTAASSYRGLLTLQSVESLAGDADKDNAQGQAYRYALINLNPFAITGPASLYTTQADALKTEHFSEQYLKDRAALLNYGILPVNTTDGSYQDDSTLTRYYNDAKTGIEIHESTDSRQQVWFGDAGANTLLGANKGDFLYGGGGADTLDGNGGDDYLEGGLGKDTLYGGAGSDLLLGGDGDDSLYGGASGVFADVLNGGKGNDSYYIMSADGDTIIRDSDGIGKIYVNGNPLGNNIKAETAGGNSYKDDDEHRYLFTDNKLAIVLKSGQKITIENYNRGSLGLSFNTASTIPESLPSATNAIFGDREDDKADVLTGTPGADHILAGDANDFIEGYAGNDIIEGGTGLDLIGGGAGDDWLFGGAGSDVVFGGFGNDYLYADSYQTIANASAESNGLAERGSLLSGGYDDDILVGNKGQDALFGGSGKDLLIGSAGDDVLFGDADADQVSRDWSYQRVATEFDGIKTFIVDLQFAASATVLGDEDTLLGGAGDDWLFAGFGDDLLDGGDGNDVLLGGEGNDTLFGGKGNDELNGDDDGLPAGVHGNDFIYGGEGDDQLRGGYGDDFLDGGLGIDVLFGNVGNDQLYGGDGDDLLFGDDLRSQVTEHGNDYLNGGNGDDKLYGNGGSDSLNGGAGDDLILGEEGNDLIQGGEGKDLLIGGEGDDRLFGNAGDDELQGGIGNDYLEGNSGSDKLFGQNGVDQLFGNAGDDELQGGNGNDYLEGNSGSDKLFGQNGDDQIYGNSGNDLLFGEDGVDRLFGNTGDDELQGGNGNDFIDGGTGNDVLHGGSGNDLYRLGLGTGRDVIFELGSDSSVLKLYESESINNLDYIHQGDDLVISIKNSTDSVRLKDFYLHDQVWRIEDSNGNVQVVTKETVPNEQPWFFANSLPELRARFLLKVQNYYSGLLRAHAYNRLSDSSFVKESIDLNTNKLNKISVNLQVIDKNITDQLPNSFSETVVDTGQTEIRSNTSLKLVSGDATYQQGKLGSVGFYDNQGGYVNFSQIIALGYSGIKVSGYLPQLGLNLNVNHASGLRELQVDGFWSWSGDQPVFVNTNENRVLRVIDNDAQLNILNINGDNEDNIVILDEHYFNVIDGGGGNDFLSALNRPSDVSVKSIYGDSVSIKLPNNRLIINSSAPGTLLSGGLGDDTLIGGFLDDTLIGGAGVDHLEGGPGDDTYVIFDSTGVDIIFDDGWINPNRIQNDIVYLPSGVELTDLSVHWGERIQNSLYMGDGFDKRINSLHTTLNLSWGRDNSLEIVLPHSDQRAGNGIDAIRFSNGTSVSLDDIKVLAGAGFGVDPHLVGNVLQTDISLYGGDGNDHLALGNGGGQLIGGAGQDILIGSDGNDNLIGGEITLWTTSFINHSIGGLWGAGDVFHGGGGDDFLRTTAGNDTIEFGLGDGHDKVANLLHDDIYFLWKNTKLIPDFPSVPILDELMLNQD